VSAVASGRLRAPLLAALVVGALSLAACGGGAPAGVAPAAYVKSICQALGNWKSDVQSAGQQLESSGAGSASPPTAKRYYVQFVHSLRTATQKAATALSAAGTPAVKNGTNIAHGLTDAFNRGTNGLAKAESEARAIRTTNATIFDATASQVTAQIRTALQGIASVTPRNSSELKAAASKDPTCQSLNSAS
jgi:hypothetical protein